MIAIVTHGLPTLGSTMRRLNEVDIAIEHHVVCEAISEVDFSSCVGCSRASEFFNRISLKPTSGT